MKMCIQTSCPHVEKACNNNGDGELSQELTGKYTLDKGHGDPDELVSWVYLIQGCRREVIKKAELHFMAKLTVNYQYR